jgi:hypothetical protein
LLHCRTVYSNKWVRTVHSVPRRNLLCSTLFLCAANVNAGAIIGGSDILSLADAQTLEGWLGEGPIALTRIFAKDVANSDFDDSRDWHREVDLKGRTISVWEVTLSDGKGGADEFVFGGYNPQSWDGSGAGTVLGGYVETLVDTDRNAFIFNLTTSTKLEQCKTSYDLSCGFNQEATGSLQTYNRFDYGPTFGNGHDLYVNGDLDGGYNYHYAFGLPGGDPESGGNASPLDNDDTTYLWGGVGALETFTISARSVDDSHSVPNPATVALLGLGLLGLRFRRK